MQKHRTLTSTEARAVWCSGKEARIVEVPRAWLKILNDILQQQQPRKISEPKFLSFASKKNPHFRKGTEKAR